MLQINRTEIVIPVAAEDKECWSVENTCFSSQVCLLNGWVVEPRGPHS